MKKYCVQMYIFFVSLKNLCIKKEESAILHHTPFRFSIVNVINPYFLTNFVTACVVSLRIDSV